MSREDYNQLRAMVCLYQAMAVQHFATTPMDTLVFFVLLVSACLLLRL